MTGIPKIEIEESVESLKNLMKQQKTGLGFAKVQSLYLLKIQAVETVRHLAVIVGREERTIHRWLELYRKSGLKQLLEEPPKTGRPQKLSIEQVAQLQQELKDPEGFVSYQEVQIWSYVFWGIKIVYATLYKVIRSELKAQLKVPRPRSKKQDPKAIEVLIKQRPERLRILKEENEKPGGEKLKICYWCQDKTRIGLRTITRRKLTLRGVKPIGEVQWQFKYYYVYGLVEPKTGRSFFYEFSHFNTDCFQRYLEEFSQEYPDEKHIIQLDNAPCHTAQKLKVPENIVLFFQPTYCPQVNPIERFWQ